MFHERENRRTLNARLARRARVAPATLADGRPGVMVSIDGNIVCFSNNEAFAFCDRIIDAMEGEHEVG